MLCSAVFVFFLIPETKNIPLEGIERLFDRRLKAREAHAVVWRELGEEEEVLRVGLREGGLDKEGVDVEQLERVDDKV